MPKQKDRNADQRRQHRAARKNAKRKKRRRIQAREKHKIMTRQKDIDNLSSEIEGKKQELQGLQMKVQTYSQEVTDSVQAILKKAGVFEKVNKLEADRQVFQTEAQQKANVLQGEINTLSQTRSWLIGQDKADEGDDGAPEKKPAKKADLEVVAPADDDADDADDADDGDVPAKPEL